MPTRRGLRSVLLLGDERCGLSSTDSGLQGEQTLPDPPRRPPLSPFWVSGTVGADMVAGEPVWATFAPRPSAAPREPQALLPPAFELHPPIAVRAGSPRPLQAHGRRAGSRAPGLQGP